jgi:hypothetical protein
MSGRPMPMILHYFSFAHLPLPLQDTSRQFAELAYALASDLPDNEERTVALRKLLEAKDAAVRAKIGIKEEGELVNDDNSN